MPDPAWSEKYFGIGSAEFTNILTASAGVAVISYYQSKHGIKAALMSAGVFALIFYGTSKFVNSCPDYFMVKDKDGNKQLPTINNQQRCGVQLIQGKIGNSLLYITWDTLVATVFFVVAKYAFGAQLGIGQFPHGNILYTTLKFAAMAQLGDHVAAWAYASVQ